MFYILSRIFACIASPAFWIVVIFIWAILANSKITRIILSVLAILMVAFFTNTTIYNKAFALWCSDYMADIDTTKHYDYAIIPGGISDIDTVRWRMEYGEASDRIIDCVWLMNKGIVDKMIITGDGSSNRQQHLPFFYDHIKTVYGISANRILIEPKAVNTIENFTRTLELYGNELKGKKILVVNSALYMRRTMLCCRKVDLQCDFYSVDINTSPRSRWETWVPDFGLFYYWMKLMHECIGYMAYIFY